MQPGQTPASNSRQSTFGTDIISRAVGLVKWLSGVGSKEVDPETKLKVLRETLTDIGLKQVEFSEELSKLQQNEKDQFKRGREALNDQQRLVAAAAIKLTRNRMNRVLARQQQLLMNEAIIDEHLQNLEDKRERLNLPDPVEMEIERAEAREHRDNLAAIYEEVVETSGVDGGRGRDPELAKIMQELEEPGVDLSQENLPNMRPVRKSISNRDGQATRQPPGSSDRVRGVGEAL